MFNDLINLSGVLVNEGGLCQGRIAALIIAEFLRVILDEITHVPVILGIILGTYHKFFVSILII